MVRDSRSCFIATRSLVTADSTAGYKRRGETGQGQRVELRDLRGLSVNGTRRTSRRRTGFRGGICDHRWVEVAGTRRPWTIQSGSHSSTWWEFLLGTIKTLSYIIVRRSTRPCNNQLIQDDVVLAALVRLDRLPIIRDIVHPEPSVEPAHREKHAITATRQTYPTLPYPE